MNENLILEESPRARTPWKTIALSSGIIFTLGCYTSISIYHRVSNWYPKARQELILQAIDKDLAENPISVSLQNRSKLSSGNASKDDLLKLLYLQRIRLEQYEQDMTVMRDVLGMPREAKEGVK